jgi:UDP-N-acetylmuramate--alanine ligase
LDHVDNFPNLEAIHKLFIDFIQSIKPGGFLVACTDGKDVSEIIERANRSDITLIGYGLESGELTFSNLSLQPTGSFSRVIFKGKVLGEMELAVPGEHNVLNSLAVIGVALSLGLPAGEVISGLKNFTGARRRFEIRGVAKGVTVVDDYGHHPTEITATLKAARTFAKGGRVLVIFQPHRYSRTREFIKQFQESLALADQVYLLEIYSAGENPIPGVSSKLIADGVENSVFNPSMIEVASAVAKSAQSGDLIITLGAGDVNALVPVILDNLNAN